MQGVQLPEIGIIIWIIDTLASRYGWTKHQILEEMYWEEVWEQVQVASNIMVYKTNQEMYFQFCLHAGSKDAIKNWKDSPLPFPDKAKEAKRKKPHYGGLDQLPQHIPVKRIDLDKLKPKKNGNIKN